MLKMPTRQFRNPVVELIFVESRDWLVHGHLTLQLWNREVVDKLSGNNGWLCIIRSGSRA